jgi:CheY-like chemotaxis protein
MTKNIMVVDDTVDNIELMHTILSMNGFNPTTFTNPLDAMSALKKMEQLPDLLILDMRMPNLSGVEFCTELRKDTKFDKMRIVFFTASSDLDKTLLDKYHVLGFIYKPFDIKGLVDQVTRYSEMNIN